MGVEYCGYAAFGGPTLACFVVAVDLLDLALGDRDVCEAPEELGVGARSCLGGS